MAKRHRLFRIGETQTSRWILIEHALRLSDYSLVELARQALPPPAQAGLPAEMASQVAHDPTSNRVAQLFRTAAAGGDVTGFDVYQDGQDYRIEARTLPAPIRGVKGRVLTDLLEQSVVEPAYGYEDWQPGQFPSTLSLVSGETDGEAPYPPDFANDALEAAVAEARRIVPRVAIPPTPPALLLVEPERRRAAATMRELAGHLESLETTIDSAIWEDFIGPAVELAEDALNAMAIGAEGWNEAAPKFQESIERLSLGALARVLFRYGPIATADPAQAAENFRSLCKLVLRLVGHDGG